MFPDYHHPYSPGVCELRLGRRPKRPLCTRRGLLEPHRGCGCMWLGMDLLSTYYVPRSGSSEVLCTTLCPPSSPDQGELGDPSMGLGQL